MISEVYWWIDDDSVIVFDQHGSPMTGYNGPRQKVVRRIVKAASPSVKFYQASLVTGSKRKITRAEFTKTSA